MPGATILAVLTTSRHSETIQKHLQGRLCSMHVTVMYEASDMRVGIMSVTDAVDIMTNEYFIRLNCCIFAFLAS